MLKSVVLPGAAITLAAAALLLPLFGEEAVAQAAQPFVNVVDLQITPASMPRIPRGAQGRRRGDDQGAR